MASIEQTVKTKSGIADFVHETRQEAAKVTWPDRKETLMTTVMIIVMALLAGVFFLMVDSALGYTVSHLLGMGS